MDYSFNGEIARIYGIKEAIFIHNIYWSIAKNEANGRHYYDEKNWTYSSIKAFTALFPFFTEKQIRATIKKLVDNGALFVGNYNLSAHDRTQWYALDKCVTDLYQTAGCCVGISTDVNTVSKHINEAQLQSDIICKNFESSEIQNLFFDYIDMRKSIKSKVSAKSLDLLIKKLKSLSSKESEQKEIIENAIMSNWKSFYPLIREKTKGQKQGSLSSKPTYDLDKIQKDAIKKTLEFGAKI